MSTSFAITGATGQLGRLVIPALLARGVEPRHIVGIVRDPARAATLLPKGVVVRAADYDRPETLATALAGVDKLLLISANEVGKRLPQHRAVIDAAKAAGVKLVAYTSVLHADHSPLSLADEHFKTEQALAASGLPYVVLRNGWYTENYTSSLGVVLEHGVRIGGSGNGKISAATRADYADAAAAVLVSADDQGGRIYELAGDDAFTASELVAELSRQTGKPLGYRDLPEDAYKSELAKAGLPEPYAALLAQSDVSASRGALFEDGRALARLIGRRTTPLSAAIATALRARA